MKALGFFYDWSGRRTLDPYFRSIANAFADLGIELDVVLANELIHPRGGQETRNPLVDEAKLIAWTNARAPDLIFSVNNAGLSARLMRETTAPIVDWLVDDVPHLFWPDGFGTPDRHFDGRERFVCYSSTLAAQVEAAFPQARGRVSWVSHGTDIAGRESTPLPAAYPVAFVGSCLDVRPLIRLLGIARVHGAATGILADLAAMRADYVVGSAGIARTPALDRSLADAGLTWLDYHRVLADAVTTQNRTEGLRRVADQGLHLWGNATWLESLSATTELADAFQFDNPVTSYEQLLDVYARSKISINIPNVQNCAGLAARVFDAMASPSLLITEHHPDSDLSRLFGADCPVPTYRNFDHLRGLCAYYLEHEDERRELVARCNRLVDDRFLLRNRLRAILEAAKITVPAAPAKARAFRIAEAGAFHGIPRDLDRLGPWAALLGKRAAKRALGPAAAPVRKLIGR